MFMVKGSAITLTGLLTKTALFAGLWWLITQGRADAWLVGIPTVILAVFASVRLSEHALPRLSIVGLLRFLGLFLRESLSGGIDVARRTLEPKLRIEPGFSQYRFRIHDPRARVLLINCIGLLPGTLAADCVGDFAELHLLDANDNPDPQIGRLEEAIARLFKLTLETTDD